MGKAKSLPRNLGGRDLRVNHKQVLGTDECLINRKFGEANLFVIAFMCWLQIS